MRAPALALVLVAASCRPEPTRTGDGGGAPAAPVAPRDPTTVVRHGERIEDPYAWLRDREDPRTRAYLSAENAYAAAMMKPYDALRQRVLAELRSRVIENDRSVPMRDGDYEYLSRTRAGEQYGAMLRTRTGGQGEQVVLDYEARARGSAYYGIGDVDVSPDQRLVAVTEDLRGDERYRLSVIEIESGRVLEHIDRGLGPSVEWAADSRTYFHTELDEAHREHRLLRRTLGESGTGTLVIEEPDPRFAISIDRTLSDAFMVIGASSQITSEVQIVDATHPEQPPRMFEPRRDGIEYEVDHQGDRFFVLTNDGASEFRVMVTPVTSTGRASWRPLYTPPTGVTLSGMGAFVHHLVLEGRDRGLPQVWIRSHDGGETWPIAWPEAAYAASIGAHAEPDPSQLRVHYASPTTPDSVYDYDIARRELVLRKRDAIPQFDPSRYVVERIGAHADDGTEIPISLVRRADAARPAPLVLYGYGAYGSVYDADFDAHALPLLDRGVTVAIAHVRGGGELGRSWYEQGKLARKINTFTDFIRCAEYLIAERHTAADRLIATGGSAGGLLVGAVINMRPELFHAAVAEVPFVDVINTMSDPSLPLTASEWEEWGDPRQADAYAWMRSWSPYENVRAQAYPHLLVVSGWNDSRVGYWEPSKWTARLRATKTDEHVLLLHTEMGSGHGGASGRYDALAERAMTLAFMLDALSVER